MGHYKVITDPAEADLFYAAGLLYENSSSVEWRADLPKVTYILEMQPSNWPDLLGGGHFAIYIED